MGSLQAQIWKYSCHANINTLGIVAGILILIDSLGSLKAAKTMDMMHVKCKLPNNFPYFQ